MNQILKLNRSQKFYICSIVRPWLCTPSSWSLPKPQLNTTRRTWACVTIRLRPTKERSIHAQYLGSPFIQSTKRLTMSWMPYLTKKYAQKSTKVVSFCPLSLVCCQPCRSVSSSALVSHTLGPVSSKLDALWNCSIIQTKEATLAMSAFMGGKKTFEHEFINHD